MNNKPEELVQEKRETLLLLREKDRRAEKDVYQMLESEVDKEMTWRLDPNRYETSDSVLKAIYDMLSRLVDIRALTSANSPVSGLPALQVTRKRRKLSSI